MFKKQKEDKVSGWDNNKKNIKLLDILSESRWIKKELIFVLVIALVASTYMVWRY